MGPVRNFPAFVVRGPWGPEVDWPTSRRVVFLTASGAAVIVFLRLGVAPLRWTLWAEDGDIFLGNAWSGSGALWEPYAGYLHAIPRLVAWGVAMLPVEWAAAVMTASATAVAVFCAYFCARRMDRVLTRTWSRCVLVMVVVAGPAAMSETVGNVANLHWVLTTAAILAVWMPVHGPDGRRDIAGGLVCLIAAVSDPLAAFALVPAGIVIAGLLRAPASQGIPRSARVKGYLRTVMLPLGALAVGLIAQMITILTHPRETGGVPDIVEFVYLGLAYLGPRTLLGYPLATAAAALVGSVTILVLAALLVFATWVAAVRALPQHRLGSLAAVAVLSVVVALGRNWNPELLDIRFPHGSGRYAYIAAVLTAIASLALADSDAFTIARGLGQVAVGMIVFGLVANVVFGSTISRAPSWTAGVRDARASCTRGEVEEVPIAPRGWTAPVPCGLLIARSMP